MKQIFVSHKSNSAKLTSDIIETLKFGMIDVDFFLSENITKGDNWRRSDDGAECVCRVVFVDAFAPPSSSYPSRLQLLANGLRLAVRTRLEVLDKYRGAMAQESSRLAQSEDPAEALGKLHPLGGRILESIRTIVLEAELQGSKLDAPPPNLFDDDAEQATYKKIRGQFKSWLTNFQHVTVKEDSEPEGKYAQTELLLDELYDMNGKYIVIAAPNFLRMSESSHQQCVGPMNSIDLSRRHAF